MRFLSLTTAAFVSSTGSMRKPHDSSTACPLVPPAVVMTELSLPPTVSSVMQQPQSVVNIAIQDWLTVVVPPAFAADASPPTPKEIALLREALASFYGVDRDLVKSEELLTQAIDAWQRQPPDEQAALYRVRGDCYLAELKPQEAEKDYTIAINFLEGPGGELADKEELPAALLGRARAIRSEGVVSKEKSLKASRDYQKSLRLSSREEWDTDEELFEDGASRNPYATWECGMELRAAGLYDQAYQVHTLAADSFADIADKARSIICSLDAGIDLAATGKTEQAKKVLKDAIDSTTKAEARDVELLQRVIAKEGEARIALASILWDNKERGAAEAQLGEACTRLDQLDADATARNAKLGRKPELAPSRLKFSIDDGPGAFDLSCTRFKNEKFLTETLQWPDELKTKVIKLENLGK